MYSWKRSLWLVLLSGGVLAAAAVAQDREKFKGDKEPPGEKAYHNFVIPQFYRGPSDTVPPNSGPPGGGPGDGGTAPPGTIPPPSVPQATPPNLPVPPPTGRPGRLPTRATTTRGGSVSESLDLWETWWRNNGDPYLRIPRDQQGSSMSARPFYTGRGSHRSAATLTPLVNPDVVRTQVLPDLALALRDSHALVAEASSIALGRAAPDSAEAPIAALIRDLLQDSRTRIRDTSLLSLGILSSSHASEALLAIASDAKLGRNLTRSGDGVSSARQSLAALALGMIGEQEAARTLLSTLERAPNSDVQAALILGAARAAPSSPDVAAIALKYLRDPRANRSVRAQAAIALARMQSTIGRAGLVDLVRLLAQRDTPEEVKISCVVALGALCNSGDSEALEAVLRRVREGGDPRLRHMSWMAIGRILENDTPDLRSDALREPVVHLLLRGVLRPDRKADRPWAALAVGIALRDDPQHSELRRLAAQKVEEVFRQERDPSRAGALAISLGLMGWGEATDSLVKALKRRPPEEYGAHLAQALGLSSDKSAVVALSEQVVDTKARPQIRVEAARGLGLLRVAAVVSELGLQLERARSLEDVRALCGALGALRCEEAIPPLLALLRDRSRSAESRAQAASALGYLGEQSPVSWYTAYSVNSNYHVRNPALDLFVR